MTRRSEPEAVSVGAGGLECSRGNTAEEMTMRMDGFRGLRRGALAGLCIAFAGLVAVPVGASADRADDEIPDVRVPGAVSPVTQSKGQNESRALKRDYSGAPAGLHVVLPPPSAEEEKRGRQASKRKLVFIGFHRHVPVEFEGNLSPAIEWSEQADGSFVGSFHITSSGAASLRVGIRADLPLGAEIRFFGPGSDERFPVSTHEDLYVLDGEIRTLWSPSVDGDTLGIEISLPSEKAVDAFRVAIDTVAHSGQAIVDLGKARKLDCSHIHIDVECRADRTHGSVEDAVAQIRFEDDGGSYLCTGTLVNDTLDDSFIPYFLTANHCLGTQRVADTLEAWWFYQRESCGDAGLDPRFVQISGGADLLATRMSSDITLLRLRGPVPGGLAFAGWSSGAISHPAGMYGIHHPAGVIKKYSGGSTRGNRDSEVEEEVVRNAIGAQWSEGVTEGGSSGSGLFLRDGGHLVGVLSHGPDCDYNITDYYGPFRDFYPQASRWLDPDGTSPILDDHGNTCAGATEVRLPSTTVGVLERGVDVDAFRFQVANSGGTLQVHTTGSTDTHGTLTRAASPFRLTDEDGGSGDNFSIEATGADAGTWCVEVRGHSSTEAGAYRLHVLPVSGALGKADVEIPLVLESSGADQGFVRVFNRSRRSGYVRIHAIDDNGRRSGPAVLWQGAEETKQFNSRDLEDGNPSQGLYGGVGGSTWGHWRLELRADHDIEARAYIRTPDGFLTSMDQVAEETEPGSLRYYVPFFNPGSNRSQLSVLRIINPDPDEALVVISGVDSKGNAAPQGDVRLRVPGGGAVFVTARQLEQGSEIFPLEGRLGDGAGKWQLYVESDRPLRVMSIMDARSGHLSNLSR